MAAPIGSAYAAEPEHIRAELERVLASETFSRAASLAQFLSYVCRKALSGETDQIKEYSIAVEAFGRAAAFDQKRDAIVRVEAHRLRRRLAQYYGTEGKENSIEIVIPPGQYVPLFVLRGGAPADSARGGNGAVEVAPVHGATAEPAGEPERSLTVVPAVPPLSVPVAPVVRRRSVWIWTVVASVAVAAVAAAIWVPALRRQAASENAAAQPARAGLPPPTPLAEEEGLRIAAGLIAPKYVDSLGNTWLGDRYFLGGEVIGNPRERILRSRDPLLFATRREGDFRYDIPLTPGVYELHLFFAERVFGAGNIAGGGETSRLFHVFANGIPLIEMLDVLSDASGGNTADVRVFTDLRPGADGYLHLHFSPFKEKAFVNGIVILPGIPGKMRPVRVLAGESSYRDRRGQFWGADRFSIGGQVVSRSEPVAGATDPEIYQTERHGNFSYAIPVAEGRYTLTLHFAETWFGPNKPSGGGAGSRLFDVFCNGEALLRRFDIYKTAGGGNIALQRSFRHLAPNAQGKLLLSFVPVKNYACVNAIEIVAE